MSEQIHKRRKRYKGTHPRNFEDKYKELNPEKYPETIEKVISKGSTPAGMHNSRFFRYSTRTSWFRLYIRLWWSYF